jgi:type IV pilus assembly protein PilB
LILVTGPTGSGKSTTLATMIDAINDRRKANIITVEDPIEVVHLDKLSMIHQREVGGDTDAFAEALRRVLRQDPDVIMIGEMRDVATIDAALKAAETGHLVLSTLHTNDAPSTINRLMNMGIEPFLVATSVNLIVAQRLIRRVCQKCKQPEDVPVQALLNVGFSEAEAPNIQLYKGRGCDACNQRGYKGRVALFEVMRVTEDMRELILSGASAVELRRKALEEGMIGLRHSGLQKIRDGVTTIEEVVRESVL